MDLRRGPLTDLTQYINPDINNTRVQSAIGNHAFGFQRKSPKPDTYKTVMCQAWLESMKCAFGENCKFAHGEHELRPVRTQIRNNLKYKTKLCDKYTTSGICPYGSRCLFIHPAPTKPVKPLGVMTNNRIIGNTDSLQQQLEFLRSQYGPNSLPDFIAPATSPPMNNPWPPSNFFDQTQTHAQTQLHNGLRSVGELATQFNNHLHNGNHQPNSNGQLSPPSPNSNYVMSRRSFSTSSAPSSAFGSSSSLGHWPWSDDFPSTLPAGSSSSGTGSPNGSLLNPHHLSHHHAAAQAFHNAGAVNSAPGSLPSTTTVSNNATQPIKYASGGSSPMHSTSNQTSVFGPTNPAGLHLQQQQAAAMRLKSSSFESDLYKDLPLTSLRCHLTEDLEEDGLRLCDTEEQDQLARSLARVLDL